jgi:signal transduction histidine kinase/FixJ family two-component response regulator
MKKKKVKILFLEDSQDDYELHLVELKKVGFEPQGIRVETKQEFIKQLKKNTWDLILSDYELPNFNGLDAYDIVKKQKLDIPLIVIAESLSKKVAISCIEKGIENYVMKDNLARLGCATKQTLEKRDLEKSRKKTEEKLKEVYKVLYNLNKDLRCRVEERTADLSKTNELLKQKIAEYEKAEKIIKESETKYKTLYNSSQDAIIILDVEKEFILKTLLNLSPKYQPNGAFSETKFKEMILKALKNNLHFFEWKYKKIDGTEFDATVLLTKMQINNKTFLQATIRDITSRKQKERKLQKTAEEIQIMNMELKLSKDQLTLLNKNLEKKVKESQIANHELSIVKDQLFTLNKNLEQKVKQRTAEIEQLIKQKDEFIGQLGHDLKTPLSILMNILPMIQGDSIDPEVKSDCDVVIRNVEYIKSLVTETLQIAELSSPNAKFVFKELNLMEIANNVVRDNQLILEKQNIKIENIIDEEIIVKADELRLGEVFNNLISNAVKYSKDDGGSVTIDMQKDKDSIIVFVSDTGIGMTKKQLEHVFDEFYKADSSRHNLGSSGLGLSIVKRIVEKHGGRIWVDSPGENKGSVFSFTLPMVIKKDSKK